MGCMPLAASAPFQNLGPLVLGYHALHLQQQIVLGCTPQLVVEGNYLFARPLKLINQ